MPAIALATKVYQKTLKQKNLKYYRRYTYYIWNERIDNWPCHIQEGLLEEHHEEVWFPFYNTSRREHHVAFTRQHDWKFTLLWEKKNMILSITLVPQKWIWRPLDYTTLTITTLVPQKWIIAMVFYFIEYSYSNFYNTAFRNFLVFNLKFLMPLGTLLLVLHDE